MIRKSTVLLIVVIHFLAPYSMNLIKNNNVTCQCGCREWPCYCCRTPENSCDVTSVSKGKCHINEESDAPSPAVIAYSLTMGFPLDRMGYVLYSYNDLTLPGYEKPPIKPPSPD